jgi:Protein of unknown function (DUF3017)
MTATTGPRAEWPLAVTALVGLAGLVMIVFDGWRAGVFVFAAGILLAGILRLLLSDDGAGLLRVRRRTFDAVMLFGMGSAVLVLGLIIPS